MENSAEIPKLEAKPLGARLSRGESSSWRCVFSAPVIGAQPTC